MPKKKSFADFIDDCKKVNNHENFDFYGETFDGYNKKMKIKCKVCGDIFARTPANHIHLLHKCGNCSGIKKHTLQSFIEKSSKIHNNKYRYTEAIYVHNKLPIIITCPEHGNFNQRPDDHMKGRGCDKCGGSSNSNTEDFIEKSNKIHDNFYSYDKVTYTRNSKKVIITCPVHGDFLQKPNSHLNGYGCQKCLYKNETKTGKYIKEIFGIDANLSLIHI
jgi:hypothetical protein